MSFGDRLKQLGRGVGDIFSAPVGIIVDTAKAVTDSEYNPGLFGVLGGGINKLGEGLANIGEGSGLNDIAGGVVENTPIDEALAGIIHEAELLYNTEYQLQNKQAPIGLRQMGVEPGEASIQRGLATATGAVSTALPGGTPISDVGGVWRRSMESTPGRALIDNLWFVDFYNKSPQEQDRIRAQTWYNMATGTVDAVSRWFTQPEVLAGKGIKSVRSRLNPSPEKLVERANQMWKAQGYSFEISDTPGPRGAVNLQIKGAKGQKVLHVTRTSNMDSMQQEGILRVPQGADDAFAASEYWGEMSEVVQRRTGFPGPEMDVTGAQAAAQNQVLDELDRLFGTMEAVDDSAFNSAYYRQTLDEGAPDFVFTASYYLDKGLYESFLRQVKGIDGPELEIMRDELLRRYYFEAPGTGSGRSPDEINALGREADDWVAEQSRRYQDFGPDTTPNDVDYFFDMMELGGAPMDFVQTIGPEIFERAQGFARNRFNRTELSKGIRATQGMGTPTPHPAYRGLYLLGDGDWDEAKRYASALYEQDPSDMPVIIEIEADGLPVMFEDFMDPLMPDRRSGLPSDASLITMADQIPPDKITGVTRFGVEDLDSAIGMNKATGGYHGAGGRIHPKLYNPDGTVISPDKIVDADEMIDIFLTSSRLYGESPIMAQKFLRNVAMQKAVGNIVEDADPIARAMSHKTIQQVLNQMDGMDATEIRRVFFPNHIYGGRLSDFLASAGSYKERRAVLAAAMGMRTPEFDVLPEILQTRLKLFTEEFERVKQGKMPENYYLAMIGGEDILEAADSTMAMQLLEEGMEEIRSQLDLVSYKANISRIGGILSEVPKPQSRRVLAAHLRKTNWYANGPLGRPLRSVIENRPHQFVNVGDPMSDVQLVRQLEEAIPLGIKQSRINHWHNRYLAAATPQEKVYILQQAENEIIEAAAKHGGMSRDQIDELLRQAQRGRSSAQTQLESKRYAPDGHDIINFVDGETGEVVEMVLPLLSTQTSPWVPLADVREIIAVSSKIRRLKTRGISVPKEILEQFNQLWKPTVLLRGGWPLRIIPDEQLRILAKTGSLLKHLASIEAGGSIPKLTNMFDPGLTIGQRAGATFATITGTQPLTAIGARTARQLSRAARKLKALDPEYYKLLEDAGVENLASARAGHGGPNEEILHSMQALMGRDEATVLDHLFTKGTGQWRTVTPESKGYGAAWLRAVNDQLGRDPLVQASLKGFMDAIDGGLSFDDAAEAFLSQGKAFLRTKEGLDIAARMPWRSTNPDKWLEEIFSTIGHYTGDFDEGLIKRILSGKVVKADLEKIDEALRPATVHGEVIDQTLGTSAVSQYVGDMISTTYDLLGRLPTDTLSRQPFFRHMYAEEMTRMRRIATKNGTEMSESVVRQMDTGARAFALNEVRTLLYDLAETSRFGHMMRFFMPFYPAWQEVLQIWSGLMVNDPSIFGRALLLWKAPDRAGLTVEDDDGNQFIQIRLSEKVQGIMQNLGWSEYEAKYVGEGGIRLGKDSFNLVLNSPLPGVGPIVQIPINEVAKNKPELEEALKFLLPFGVKTDMKEIIFSPLVRQMESELRGPEAAKTYQRDFINALSWMDVQYRLGAITTPPTLEEAHNIAKKIHTLRLFARLSSPAQPIFDSPLQPYADIYRDLIETQGPENADEVFLNQYGSEFFAVTLSRTVSTTGLPPTVEAEVARRQFDELITAHPEYGRLIVGDQALGEFSSAAYAAQLNRDADDNPTTTGTERQYREAEIDPRTGGVIEIDRRLGWQEYIRMMDLIDLERQKLGLPNLRVKKAQPLADLRRQMTAALAQKYPSWFEDFSTRDELKWDKRIGAFKDISENPLLEDRPDVEGIQTYLEYRSLIVQELNRRSQMGGAKTLNAMSNADLAELWESMVFKIISENVAFGPVYYRYLEGDPVR